MCCAWPVTNAVAGCYGLAKLIAKRRRDGKIVDWLEELTADCQSYST
jgi:hypothetical protein